VETKIWEFETTERDGYPNLKGRRDDSDEIRKDRETERERDVTMEKRVEGHKAKDT
jgi:hypothetical protein